MNHNQGRPWSQTRSGADIRLCPFLAVWPEPPCGIYKMGMITDPASLGGFSEITMEVRGRLGLQKCSALSQVGPGSAEGAAGQGLSICGHLELWELGASGHGWLKQPSAFSQLSSELQLTAEGRGAPWGPGARPHKCYGLSSKSPGLR